jgi:hypothetical protein
MAGKMMSKVLAGLKNPPTSKPSGVIPPNPKVGGGAASTYRTEDFLPPVSFPEPNSEPASQAESTLKECLANQAEATFGTRGFVAPEDK